MARPSRCDPLGSWLVLREKERVDGQRERGTSLFSARWVLISVLQKASAKILPHLQIEIVKRSDQAKGFELLPRRLA